MKETPQEYHLAQKSSKTWVPLLVRKSADIERDLLVRSEDPDLSSMSVDFSLQNNSRFNLEKADYEIQKMCVVGSSARKVWLEIDMGPPVDRRNLISTTRVGQYQAILTSIERRCERIIGKLEKDLRNLTNDRQREIIEDKIGERIDFKIINPDPHFLLLKSKESSEDSKTLIRYLTTTNEEELSPFVKILTDNIKEFINNPNSCYVVKYITKFSDQLCLSCMKLMAVPDILLEKEHTRKLVYTISNHYPKYREYLVKQFKLNPLKYPCTLPGAILMSLVISNSTDISSCEFMYKELKNNPDLVKTDYFSRALATYMQRCPKSQLEDISKLFEQNIQSLMHDNFGNYLLQIFFDRNCISGIEMTEAAILKIHKKVFLRKYSRFVLLRAIQRCNQPFLLSLLDLVLTDKTLLQSILPKTVSASLLLYCIAQCPSILLMAQFLTTGVLKDEFKPEDCCKSFDFFQELDHLIEIGVYPQNFT